MYRHGRKLQKPSRWSLWTAWGILGLIIICAGIYAWLQTLDSNTTLTQAPGVTKTITASSQPIKTFDTAAFTIDLPDNWKEVSRTETNYTIYRFQSTDPKNNNHYLEVYQDRIPTEFPVNRVLALEPNGNKITVVGSVSENCREFTPGKAAPGYQGVVAKWENVEFVCDVTNYERNVVGTSSAGSLNSVTVGGPGDKPRKFLFVYTDNAINPNYSTFYSALNSFTLK